MFISHPCLWPATSWYTACTDQVTTILLDIGLCALTLGRMEEAEVLYKRALAIESEHLGADHPDAQATARALELFAPSS